MKGKGTIDVDWSSAIFDAKAGATHRAWGEITEEDIPAIIAEAARLKGLDPPDSNSNEYRLLAEEVMSQAEMERDELNSGKVGDE